MPMKEIENYRQWESKTPGHPEVHLTPGIEMTTGPLGQGLATAVGFALAEEHLAATYNRPDYKLIDHYTYVIASDGDIMEGVTAEAASLAGHLGLGKLIVLYDDNRITLDAAAEVSFNEDVLGALRGLRLAHRPGRDGQQCRGPSKKAVKNAQNRAGAPQYHRGADHHRLRRARREHVRGPRLAARRRGREKSQREFEHRLARLYRAGRRERALPPDHRAGRTSRARVERPL